MSMVNKTSTARGTAYALYGDGTEQSARGDNTFTLREALINGAVGDVIYVLADRMQWTVARVVAPRVLYVANYRNLLDALEQVGIAHAFSTVGTTIYDEWLGHTRSLEPFNGDPVILVNIADPDSDEPRVLFYADWQAMQAALASARGYVAQYHVI